MNILASNPNDSRLNVLGVQLSNLDSDRNGIINTQDVDFLLKVNFGFYNFIGTVSVLPVTLSNASCVLSISVSDFDGGAGTEDRAANPTTTFVFLDLESTDSTLSSQLASSVVVFGSKKIGRAHV